MKKPGYQRRFYQDRYTACDLHTYRVVYKETDVYVAVDKPVGKDYIFERVKKYHTQIESYIHKDRRFLTSLKPLTVELKAPAIVKEMSRAANKAHVGPMASVAGAIAMFLGKDLIRRKCREVIIENGGDIFMLTRFPKTVGIYAGGNKSWRRLKLRVDPSDTPLGICTSSGTVGHSLSFGKADSVVIASKNASLADAVATATANRIHKPRDLDAALTFARFVKGISAVVIIFKDKLVSWGNVEFAV